MGAAKSSKTKRRRRGRRSAGTMCFFLELGAVEYPLPEGEYDIGRSTDCAFRIDSQLISRHHARLTVTDVAVLVEDLGSRNGVYVDDVRIDREVAIEHQAMLRIGSEEMKILARSESTIELRDERSPTMTRDTIEQRQISLLPPEPSVEDESTANADGFNVLAGVADKMFSMGQAAKAEKMLGTHLTNLLAEVTAGTALESDRAHAVARLSLRLATEVPNAGWFDYVLDLYLRARLIMSAELVDDLYFAVRKVRPVDRRRIRAYVELLDAKAGELSPSQRFVLQRMEGLEQLAAHL